MIEFNKIFVDTNILVYTKLSTSEFFKISQDKLANLYKYYELCLSTQVLREYLSTMSKLAINEPTFEKRFLINDIRNFVENFSVFDDTISTVGELHNIYLKYDVSGKQIHDANIVATMFNEGINTIFTHNTQDFQRYSDIINIIPLIK